MFYDVVAIPEMVKQNLTFILTQIYIFLSVSLPKSMYFLEISISKRKNGMLPTRQQAFLCDNVYGL